MLNRCASLPLLLALGCAAPGLESSRPGARVILISVDGLRWQELFTGVDRSLLEDPEAAGLSDTEALRERFWRETPQARREALLPFFWGEFAPRGSVYGDRSAGSRVQLLNPHHFSFPGYAELLTGRYLPEITSNDPVRVPVPTILEHARDALDLPRAGVAVFASWARFREIVEHTPGSLVVSAGYQDLAPEFSTARSAALDRMQHELLTPWDSVRHDWITAELALEYLRTHAPSFTYVALGETDDWAHMRRYDRTLQAAVLFDDFLRTLVAFVDESHDYAGRTTLIVTSDHGRGPDGANWTSHGADVPGADSSFVAILGPRTPARGALEGGPELSLAQIAATALVALGLDPADYHAQAAAAIPGAVLERR